MAIVEQNIACIRKYDLCVVGAGAAGLAVAGSASEAGLSVLIVERGGVEPSVNDYEPGIAAGVPHDPLALTTRQGLGGTLNIWGGRCVPFDPEDFRPRDGVEHGWAITYDEYARWIQGAADFLGVDTSFARAVPEAWAALDRVRVDTVELLAPGEKLNMFWNDLAKHERGPDILLHATVVEFIWNGTGIAAVKALVNGELASIEARSFVLACGGLQTARILLAEDARVPGRILGSDAVGRYYMGHLTGSISEITFSNRGDAALFGYQRDAGRMPARRRFLLNDPDIPAVAFWVESLPAADPRHLSGELSFKALAGKSRDNLVAHIRNILRDSRGAVNGIGSAIHTRLHPRDRHPNRLISNGKGPYRLVYHAEHLPICESRVRLAGPSRPGELPEIKIEFDYGAQTLSGLVRAHKRLALALVQAGSARLTFDTDESRLVDQIGKQARDGYHQIGLTRMSDHPEDGVVDPECRVHGTDNLFVASASVFPVAGQANPTLSIVAMALRLAAMLTERPRAQGRNAA